MKLLMENLIYWMYKVAKTMLIYYFILILYQIHYTASSLMAKKFSYFKEKQVILTIIFILFSFPFIHYLLFVCLFKCMLFFLPVSVKSWHFCLKGKWSTREDTVEKSVINQTKKAEMFKRYFCLLSLTK